jgi:hypothetical protein
VTFLDASSMNRNKKSHMILLLKGKEEEEEEEEELHLWEEKLKALVLE